jgi:hypothetical protein
MRRVLLNSSVYIAALRAGDDAVVMMRRLAPDAAAWLSAVALEGLDQGESWPTGQWRRTDDSIDTLTA